MCEIYLGFQEDDIVSRRSLERLGTHYKLDKMLSCVYIPKITVKWEDDSHNLKILLDSWKCVGRTDLVMIFDWLKERQSVTNILEVIVDDNLDSQGLGRGPYGHSDQAIIKCLEDLKIETWNWMRLDISSNLIDQISGKYVKEVHLYCGGSEAVLRNWSDKGGLPTLKNVRPKL